MGNCNADDDTISQAGDVRISHGSAMENLFVEYATNPPSQARDGHGLTSAQSDENTTKLLCRNVPLNLQPSCAKDVAHCSEAKYQLRVTENYELYGTLWASV